MSDKNYLAIYAKSFNWAGFFLPKNTYQKCSTLYDFCRTIDDIADKEVDLEIKKKKFYYFRNNFTNKNFDNSTIKSMWNLIDEYSISLKIINDLFDGVESDLKENVQLNTKKDLLVYSYRVAGTVGLMMAKILNVKNTDAMKSAIDLGIAMQLTNIARDVVEDSKNNRFYIRHNFETITNTLNMANTFYESSFSSIKEIPFNFRFAILVARRVYRKIGDKILTKNNISTYNTSGKIYLSNFGKVVQTFLSIFDLLKLMLINQKNHLRNEEHLLINEEVNLNERI